MFVALLDQAAISPSFPITFPRFFFWYNLYYYFTTAFAGGSVVLYIYAWVMNTCVKTTSRK